jgi:hypothetical protein
MWGFRTDGSLSHSDFFPLKLPFLVEPIDSLFAGFLESPLHSSHRRASSPKVKRRLALYMSCQDARAAKMLKHAKNLKKLEQSQADSSKIERTGAKLSGLGHGHRYVPQNMSGTTSNFGGGLEQGVWWYVPRNITCHFVSRINGKLHKISLGFARACSARVQN